MAKKSEGKAKSSGGRKLLEAAQKYQNELQAKGLSATVIKAYEQALGGIDNEKKGPNAAAQTLMRDLGNEVGAFQAAMRKEFPGNAQFLAFFKASEPMPSDARGLLAAGRQVASEAPNFSSNLIRHALNAADVKHLTTLCDALEKELGGLEPRKEAGQLETQIRDAARHAFEGQPQLSEFGE